jgi:ribosomal protein S18 acetylase RimI-like enzyme
VITLRPATPADARAIARIHVETWRTTYAGMLPDKTLIGMNVDAKASAWRRALSAPEAIAGGVLLAEAEGTGPIGFASSGRNRMPALPFAGEVQTLYVQPDWQNQGVGRRLLQGCFATLRHRGFGSAVVWVLADNPARFFYERMGGKRAGERDEPLWGIVVHELAYGWTEI